MDCISATRSRPPSIGPNDSRCFRRGTLFLHRAASVGELRPLDDQRVDLGVLDDEGVVVFRRERINGVYQAPSPRRR